MHQRRQITIATALVSAVFAYGGTAGAQTPSTKSGSIHASGQHELKLAPQKLQLSLTIRAEGSDAKSAIESFVKHKERVKKELLEMKADEASIEIGAPQLSGSVPGMPEGMAGYQMRMIMQAQHAAGKPDVANMPKVYTAVSHVKAEWPLPTTDPDALALLPETLKDQIKARDLLGQKNKAKLDKAQQEKLEEFQATMQESGGYGTGDETQPFTVAFAAKVDAESRKQALKAAYDRAVSQAETLAAVTGHKLGELISLRSVEAPSTAIEEPNSPYAAMAAAYSGTQMMASPQGDGPLSISPGGLKIHVKVDVEFAIAN